MVFTNKRFSQVLLVLMALCIGMPLSWANKPPAADLPAPPPLPPNFRAAPPTPPPDLPDPAELHAQLNQLGELLAMSPEKLNKLRQTIEFVENMSSAEREAMRIRLSQITQATPQLREEVRSMQAAFPSIPRSDLSQFWYAASKGERESVRQRLKELTDEERKPYLNAKVEAFVRHREAAFNSMKETLKEKRRSAGKTEPAKPGE
jgi:hypothetical protein